MTATGRPRRLSTEPIVMPHSIPGYGPIFNPGLVHHDGRYHLFARAVRDGYRRNPDPGARFLDYVSDIVVLSSDDGVRYEFDSVVAVPSDGASAIEDARVQWVHDGDTPRLVMTYTHLPADPGEPWRIGAVQLELADGRFRTVAETATLLGPRGIPNKDAVMFNLADGKVALVHRIHPDVQIAVFDTLDDAWNVSDEYWADYLAELDRHVIIEPTTGSLGVGAGAPPVTTPDGHLMFFHEREATGRYTGKVALLNAHTGRVEQLADEPFLVPELEWERRGDVDDVVFVQGAHLHDDGTVYLAYGAADRCVGAATWHLDHVFDHLGRASRVGDAA